MKKYFSLISLVLCFYSVFHWGGIVLWLKWTFHDVITMIRWTIRIKRIVKYQFSGLDCVESLEMLASRQGRWYHLKTDPNFSSAFGIADLNTDHKIPRTVFFADLIYVSFWQFICRLQNIFCRNKQPIHNFFKFFGSLLDFLIQNNQDKDLVQKSSQKQACRRPYNVTLLNFFVFNQILKL